MEALKDRALALDRRTLADLAVHDRGQLQPDRGLRQAAPRPASFSNQKLRRVERLSTRRVHVSRPSESSRLTRPLRQGCGRRRRLSRFSGPQFAETEDENANSQEHRQQCDDGSQHHQTRTPPRHRGPERPGPSAPGLWLSKQIASSSRASQPYSTVPARGRAVRKITALDLFPHIGRRARRRGGSRDRGRPGTLRRPAPDLNPAPRADYTE